jgi:hypothetical protein
LVLHQIPEPEFSGMKSRFDGRECSQAHLLSSSYRNWTLAKTLGIEDMLEQRYIA